MRKIAIIGGTGIYSPETLQCFEEKVIQTPYGAALCNIGTMCGNQVIFLPVMVWDIKQLRIK